MRQPRVKPTAESGGGYVHVCNRIAGSTDDYPFTDEDRRHFIHELLRLRTLYVVEPLAWAIMGNHYHILLHVPDTVPDPEEAAQRYDAFHRGRRGKPTGPKAQRLAQRLADVSCFVQDLQQRYTRWYNQSRPVRRRGALWAGRYSSTVLESGVAVWRCWQYVEANPVRAGLVARAADYRFCTFGQWFSETHNPCGFALVRWVLPWAREHLGVCTVAELRHRLGMELERFSPENPGPRGWGRCIAVGSAAFMGGLKAPHPVPLDAATSGTRLFCFRRIRP